MTKQLQIYVPLKYQLLDLAVRKELFESFEKLGQFDMDIRYRASIQRVGSEDTAEREKEAFDGALRVALKNVRLQFPKLFPKG